MKPSDFLTELSNEKLAQYKTAAAADASKADKAGDYKKGDKRFSGIVKATKKQFANDEKKVGESAGLPSPSTYEETNDMFKSSGQRRIGTLTTEDEQIDGMAQGEIRAIIKNAIHIKNQLDKGVSLDGWMYSYVTTSNDHLNSVAEQINNPNIDEQELDEACWKGYHKEGNKKMFGKTYPNCVKNEGVAETVHTDITSKKYFIDPTKNVRMGEFEFNARTFTGGLGNPNARGLQIRAYDPTQPKGRNLIGSADFIVKSDKKGNQWLESDDTEVNDEYRSKGVAAMMYAFAKSLGNDIKASPYQSQKGREMWKKWGSDAKHLVGEQGVAEEHHAETCPHCGGEMVSEELMNEKKDACYYKVKSRYKVWPSAYASGALVKCRKKGANNWGTGGKSNESVVEGPQDDPEDYRAHLLKTLPRMMNFLSKNVKGWKPTEEQYLAAIETGYQVMKHTGDVQQAGKAMSDELNTLHRMSQSKSSVAEGAPELLKQEMPLVRHIEQELAQHGYEKGTPEYDQMFKHTMSMYRKFGNVDAIKRGVAEGKVKLYTDPSYFGAEVDNTGFDSLPVVNIPTNQLVGFEPDSKMQQPKAMANVKNILAGLEQGDNIPPILVRKFKTGYQVLDGHHRFWAYKVAKKDSIPARIVDPKDIEEIGKQGVAEGQLDEKWTKKYKDSINCSNPKGFSQKAHCAGKQKNESSILEGINQTDESLHDWFTKEKWVRMDTKGNIKGPCAKEPGEGKPKCLPQAKAHSLGKKGRASAAARKRREDPNPERHGKAINVNTKKK